MAKRYPFPDDDEEEQEEEVKVVEWTETVIGAVYTFEGDDSSSNASFQTICLRGCAALLVAMFFYIVI